MPDSDFIKLLVTVIVAVVGWIVVHRFNAKRDQTNKRRDLRVQFLLDAYRRLESTAGRATSTEEQMLAFESAIADVQLLGDPEQVKAVVEFCGHYKANNSGGIGKVLDLLRRDLRDELELKGEVDGRVFFRFERKK
ncbi:MULTISPECIES: hypothetical protein [unclassified Duganella]|uniref:hypothetical protein n=1 Tax=unclassified Duganella TaxID=2636909 RepID=UPI0011C1BD8E|nr:MULTISPECIES: hypothetical protein [unclassified Duganella]